jgi:class 3 adenylate cyclase/tetratricopeptide (TPR) repeat protein
MCRTALAADAAAGDGGKLVTVVTSDLKGSTALGEQLDPESLREVLNRYFAVMRVVFESHGGSIEKIIGDAIVAVFGLPFRHDDDPIRAVEAAAETQRALATLNDELEQLWGVRLVNRTGIATGVVHFGRDAEGQHVLIGDTIDESTAMEQNAPPLEVLMAASTYADVSDVVEAEDLGPKSLKGSDVQIQSHRLVAVRSRAAVEDVAAPEPSPGMRACQVCGEESPERYRYCISCGASASSVMARDSRKTVTIVFANPKPHTESGLPLEPAAFTDVMTRYFQAMKIALERHGGTVEKFIGDAVMAVFGLPVRHEDDALRAVRAAADMQAALPALNESFGAQYGVQLLNHIGVNTGEVIATGDASTGQRLVTGDAVNTAARLEQAAGPAEIILGELTHRLTRNEIQIDVIPPLSLKGKAEPVPAYRFVALGPRAEDAGAAATQFVGRETEMARLSEALFGATGQRRARLITIVGDAGVGKSRLIREFASTASHEAGLVRGRCLPYGDGITFWPLAEIVRGAASIASEDSPQVAIEKIRTLVDDPNLADERDGVTDRVASMLGLSDAQFSVAELMWGMRRVLEALAAERPLVMIVDDIHSAAQTFLDFIDYLLDAVDGAAIMVVCSARHELLERFEEWSADHAEETIVLAPLTESEVGTLVGELLGGLEGTVRERIATAAEGNPLYAEQIVSMLQETGAIRREGDRWVSTRASGELAIPPTVHALVAARLDALGPDERAVIEPASVVGLSFAEEAIAELVEADVRVQLERQLGFLAAKRLVRRASGDEILYRFGHLVIKDTAYGSLLKRVRVALHERFVVWAERVNRERGRETEFEEILGYHLEQAYRYRTELGVIDDEARDIAHRAADKLGRAGGRALDRSDLSAAADLLSRSADLLDAPSPYRVELRTELSEAYLAAGRLDEARSAAALALRDASELGDERLEAMAKVADSVIDVFRGEAKPEVTLGRAESAIELFRTIGDGANLARAWRLRSWQQSALGRVDEAADDSLRAAEAGLQAGDVRIANRAAMGYASNAVNGSRPVPDVAMRCQELLRQVNGDRKAESVILGALAQLRAMEGAFDEARSMSQRARELLLDLGPSALAYATSTEAFRVEVLAGDLGAAEALLRRDDDDLERIAETYFRSTVVGRLATVVALQGRTDEAEAISRIAEALASDDDTEAQILWRIGRARARAGAGAFEEAIGVGREAIDRASTTMSPIYLAEAEVAIGDVLAAAGQPGARDSYVRALELYEAKGDRTSARLLQKKLNAVAV